MTKMRCAFKKITLPWIDLDRYYWSECRTGLCSLIPGPPWGDTLSWKTQYQINSVKHDCFDVVVHVFVVEYAEVVNFCKLLVCDLLLLFALPPKTSVQTADVHGPVTIAPNDARLVVKPLLLAVVERSWRLHDLPVDAVNLDTRWR